MMGTKALAGPAGEYDISRDEPCYCVVASEDDENWYGNWVTGMGFFHVRFPKTTTRECTDEERHWMDENENGLRIGSWNEAFRQSDPFR